MTEPRRIPLPELGRLYRKAVLDAVKSKLSTTGSLKALPKQPVLADHPGITQEQAEAYRQLVHGEAFDGVHRTSLPSVLVHIAGFPVQMALMSQRNFPLPLLGMVHLSNQVHHRKPVTAGQPLQILARAENLTAHRRGTQVDIVVEVSAEGEVLYTSTSVYLGRGTYLFEKPAAAPAPREEFLPPAKTALWTLGADAGREYAAVSGDYNPIHLTGITAKALGQKRAIVHGMYSAARMLEGREPETAGHRWSIEFSAPVTLPGKVAFAAEQIDEKTQRFSGWNPRKARPHFTGELTLP
ncbi:MaoC family dehydratase [Nesterenkonia ebinurensis]|uniref:MaoC family dehydratase n=1 Tax=Nesterenkonia ebinurensis TaxID=2608252 RepID=UPI00123DC4DC|nr:MaoC/PaaZ C-terminal domain-containing protein [Nesterenkonia ebinurensis]